MASHSSRCSDPLHGMPAARCGAGDADMILLFRMPVSRAMGFAGFGAFLGALRNDHFSGLDGAARRVSCRMRPRDVSGSAPETPQRH